MWIVVHTSLPMHKNSPLSQKVFAAVTLSVDVCMFIFKILLNACIKGCGRLA
jgi:hypothetical protein